MRGVDLTLLPQRLQQTQKSRRSDHIDPERTAAKFPSAMATSLDVRRASGLASERLDKPHMPNLTKLVTENVPKKPRKTGINDITVPTDLFTTCQRSLAIVQPYQRHLTRVQKARMTESHSNLCLWKDNLSERRLELCLSYSTDLHRSILDLLCNIGKTVSKVLDATLGYTSPDSDQGFRINLLNLELQHMLRNGVEALESLNTDDPITPFGSDDSHSDGESDSKETSSSVQLNNLLCSLQKLTRLLMDTCPTLEQTSQHVSETHLTDKTHDSDLKVSSSVVLVSDKPLSTLRDEHNYSATTYPDTFKSTGMKRAGKSRSKKGCKTCKKRHVKCDEAKPTCYRCATTGRECDGYDDVADDTVQAAPNDSQLSSLPSSNFRQLTTTYGTGQERRMFAYFQAKTIPALEGSDSDFWQLVLRTSTQESVIRNAIIALATLHEDYQERGGRYDANLICEPSYQKSLQLYARALRQLNGQLADAENHAPTMTVISSILFTCFEVLRRNDMTAVVHYRAGLRELLRQIGLQKSRSKSEAMVQHTPQDELHVILRVFAHYDIQTYIFARRDRMEPLATEIPSSPPKELDLKSAVHHLSCLLVAAYQLIGSGNDMYRYWNTTDCPEDWRTHVDQALETIQSWHHALDAFFNDIGVQHDASFLEAKSLLGLRVHLIVVIVRLKTLVDSGLETSFDQFRNEFESIVSSVEEFTKSRALTDTAPLDDESTQFMMGLGVVYPLLFTAFKCREARIRRRAIMQLRKVGKEGFLEGPIMAVLAKRTMQIEERGLASGQRVPECNRIHKILHIIDYDGRNVMVELTLAKDETWKKWEIIRESVPF